MITDSTVWIIDPMSPRAHVTLINALQDLNVYTLIKADNFQIVSRAYALDDSIGDNGKRTVILSVSDVTKLCKELGAWRCLATPDADSEDIKEENLVSCPDEYIEKYLQNILDNAEWLEGVRFRAERVNETAEPKKTTDMCMKSYVYLIAIIGSLVAVALILRKWAVELVT